MMNKVKFQTVFCTLPSINNFQGSASLINIDQQSPCVECIGAENLYQSFFNICAGVCGVGKHVHERVCERV